MACGSRESAAGITAQARRLAAVCSGLSPGLKAEGLSWRTRQTIRGPARGRTGATGRERPGRRFHSPASGFMSSLGSSWREWADFPAARPVVPPLPDEGITMASPLGTWRVLSVGPLAQRLPCGRATSTSSHTHHAGWRCGRTGKTRIVVCFYADPAKITFLGVKTIHMSVIPSTHLPTRLALQCSPTRFQALVGRGFEDAEEFLHPLSQNRA